MSFLNSIRLLPVLAIGAGLASALAGPYSAGKNDPTAVDAPIPGFVGPDGIGQARIKIQDDPEVFRNPNNYVNPLFFRWAIEATNYVRSDGQGAFDEVEFALGSVTGDEFDVLSLGDLSAPLIAGGAPVGEVTLDFTGGVLPTPIRNFPGADFVVFENGFTSGAGMFTDLAYVEVSSDGVNFARFPSRALTPATVGPFGIVDPTNVRNLAGKHINHLDEESWGTPFDLIDLATDPLVLAGTVGLQAIRYVRVVDVPGDGTFLDGTGAPIYDQWLTFGSGGFDLEAVGAISVATTFEEWQDLMGLLGAERGALADPDHDGAANLVEYSAAMLPRVSDAGQLPRPELAGGSVEISFRRDVRPADVIVEVLGTIALNQPWQVIARSQNGGDLLPVAPFSPVISDASDSAIASVGVIRRQRVRAVAGQRFLRVSVSLVP